MVDPAGESCWEQRRGAGCLTEIVCAYTKESYAGRVSFGEAVKTLIEVGVERTRVDLVRLENTCQATVDPMALRKVTETATLRNSDCPTRGQKII
jgi:hypothetical protein